MTDEQIAQHLMAESIAANQRDIRLFRLGWEAATKRAAEVCSRRCKSYFTSDSSTAGYAKAQEAAGCARAIESDKG